MLIGTLESSDTIREWTNKGTLALSDTKESLAVKHIRDGSRSILAIAGADDRGLMYALLEIAQQIQMDRTEKDWFSRIPCNVSESPQVPVRSMAVLLHNEDCEKEWYYSREYWQEYFGMLAANRWNSFNLIFSHQTAYLSPLYAFHVNITEHPEIKAIGLTDDQREKNLEILRYISGLAKERGIDFTLGIWQQIAWEGKNQGTTQESMVKGLTPRKHAQLHLPCPEKTSAGMPGHQDRSAADQP